jgi:hypothetical protein
VNTDSGNDLAQIMTEAGGVAKQNITNDKFQEND